MDRINRLDFSYGSSASPRLVRHVLHTKKDLHMTGPFLSARRRWTQEEDAFEQGQKRAFENDPGVTVRDYQVSPAARLNRNAGAGSDWRAPLMVCVKSKGGAQEVSNQGRLLRGLQGLQPPCINRL